MAYTDGWKRYERCAAFLGILAGIVARVRSYVFNFRPVFACKTGPLSSLAWVLPFLARPDVHRPAMPVHRIPHARYFSLQRL